MLERALTPAPLRVNHHDLLRPVPKIVAIPELAVVRKPVRSDAALVDAPCLLATPTEGQLRGVMRFRCSARKRSEVYDQTCKKRQHAVGCAVPCAPGV